MQQPDPRLEEIKVLEDAVTIKTTDRYAGLGKFTFGEDSVQFRPTVVPYIVAFGFGIVILILTLSASISNEIHHTNRLSGPVIGILLGFFMLFMSIRQYRAQKQAKILIDKLGITLDDELYNWTDIYETAILEKPRSVYLTVVPKERTAYRLYRLTGFRVFELTFPITVSKYIQHFKSLAAAK